MVVGTGASGLAAASGAMHGRSAAGRAGLAGGRALADASLARVEGMERWLAVPCAATLLLYPNPLVAPALLVGLLPSLTRLVARGRPWPRTAFDLPILLLVLGGVLGGAAGLSGEGTALRLYGLLAGLILFAAATCHLSTPERHRRISFAALALVVVGTVAVVAIVAPFLRLDRAPPLDQLAALLEALGLSPGLNDEEALLRRFRLRASGVGALADVGLALLVALSIGLRSWPRRLSLAPLALLFALVLVASNNRGATLAGALTVAALAAFRRPILLPLLPLAALAVVILLLLGVLQKGLDTRTLDQRLTMWQNGIYLAQDLPLTGAGLGTDSVRVAYQAYFLPVYPNFSHAHNIYFQALLEQGVLGLAGLIGLTIAALVVGWRLHRRTGQDGWVLAGGTAGLGAALALLTTGMSEITAISTIGGALLLGSLGWLAAAARPPDAAAARAAAPHRLPISPGRRWALGAGALAAVLLILLPTGLGGRLAGGLLLNAGTVYLHRAVLAEETTKDERPIYLDRAVALLRIAEELDPGNPRVARNLAIALDTREDPRRGRASADRARSLTPTDDRQGQFQVGRAYATLGVWGEAIRAWERADAGPQLVQLGGRLIRARNWDQASAAFRTAAILHPQSESAYEGIGRANRERGADVEEAITELQSIASHGPENAYFAHLEIARLLRAEGRAFEALGALASAAEHGDDPALGAERGATLLDLGRFGEAEDQLIKAVAERPDEWELYAWLALAQRGQGQHLEAVETATAGLRVVGPNRQTQRATLLAIVGDSQLALGRRAEALRAYREGLALAPTDQRLRDGAERARASP